MFRKTEKRALQAKMQTTHQYMAYNNYVITSVYGLAMVRWLTIAQSQQEVKLNRFEWNILITD